MTATEFRANVLLVDDRPENLLALESVLEGLGQNLISANSGREALRHLLTEDFALILLDVQMPDLNGFELAEMIRQRERTERTPIIFVSATSKDEKFVFKGYSLGAVDYITKPFEPEILKSKVRFFTEFFSKNQEIKRQAQLLEKANSELDGLNAELEARVRRRTAQLETANAELESEIAVRKKYEARLTTEHSITRTLADAANLEVAAPQIFKIFRKHLEADISCLWQPDDSGARLVCTHIEIADDAGEIGEFAREINKIKLAPGDGLPGEVWKKNAPVYCRASAVRGEDFPCAQHATAIGLNSAIGFPVKFAGKFYGVIEFFTRRDLLFDEQKISMLDAVGSEIGQFIERKRIEAERENLLRREKLLREQAERANRLKDEFLATVSHELRTPLNAILGWGQILQTKKLGADDEQRALETIYRNATAQAQLIDDLLDTSRLITGNLRLDFSPAEVLSIVEAAIEVVRPAAEAKAIKFSTDYDASIETLVCDARRLQQIIWNLLTNAVKFTPPDGEIRVAVNQIADQVQIVVRDSGQGISPEFLPHVFERFRQADGSSTRTHNGLGLGLAIVRHLVELHGGFVGAASDGLDKGSTFTVTLPRSPLVVESIESADEEVVAYEERENLKPQLDGVRVLIVDDDVDTREMLTFALNQWGAEARTSMSAAEAFESLAAWQPDVLLTDINMPGEDGYALVGKLRSLAPEEVASIPAIALTGMARAEDGEQAIAAGFQLHLSKPVDTQKLGEAIASLTKKSP